MEPEVNYTVVGAFVITMCATIVLAIIWLSSGLSFERYSTYLIYMQESASGLTIDSPVEYNGVEVGKISSIDLNHKNPQLVEILLSIKSSTPITRGTVAMLSTRGLTGMTYIALKDRSTDLRPLVAENGQPYPIIKTVPSIFVRLETALTSFTTNFHQIAESFQSLLDKENLQSIKDSLLNIKQITGTLSANGQRFTTILTNLEKSSKQFYPFVQSTAGAMRTLQTQTLPSANQTFSNLTDASATLNEILTEVKQNPSVLIRGTTPQPLGPGETR